MSVSAMGNSVVISGITSGRGGSFREWLAAHYALALFLALFMVPTVLASVYFGLIASDRYVSETRFVVRSASKPAADGAAAYLQDIGIKSANDQAFAVQDYIRSRDAMHAISRKLDLRKIWQNEKADFISGYRPLFGPDNEEALYRHYLDQVRVEKNLETGITTVRVKAFGAEDARAIVALILQLSEAKVNEMNQRARTARLASAQDDAERAAHRLAEATAALSRYRDDAQIVDPADTAQASTAQETDLRAERARIQADLSAMLSRAPDNPAVPALRRRLAGLDAEISAQTSNLTGGKGALSDKLAGYEPLYIEQELAAKMYEAAEKQLEAAITEANRQEIFIETIVEPNMPDVPLEPQRIRYTFTVALLSFWAFLSVYLLVSGGREHLNLS